MKDLLFYDDLSGRAEAYDLPLKPQPLWAASAWHKNWHTIVSGRFGGNGENTDLLFYDAATGLGQFYSVDSEGHIHKIRDHSWRTGWDIIVPGNFSGASGQTDLLFYNRQDGLGQLYSTDGNGRIHKIRDHSWRKHWDLIVPGNFSAAGTRTDLLFYNREDGRGEFYRTSAQGDIHKLGDDHFWRHTWASIIATHHLGSGRTNLLFYDKTTREGELYQTRGQGSIGRLDDHLIGRFDHVIPINSFPTSEIAQVLFYSGTSGILDVHSYDRFGRGVTGEPTGTGFTWRRGWTHVVPGVFSSVDDGEVDNGELGPPATVRLNYRIGPFGNVGGEPTGRVRFQGNWTSGGPPSDPEGVTAFDQSTAEDGWVTVGNPLDGIWQSGLTVVNLRLGSWAVSVESPSGVSRGECDPELDIHGANEPVNFRENHSGCARGSNFPGD